MICCSRAHGESGRCLADKKSWSSTLILDLPQLCLKCRILKGKNCKSHIFPPFSSLYWATLVPQCPRVFTELIAKVRILLEAGEQDVQGESLLWQEQGVRAAATEEAPLMDPAFLGKHEAPKATVCAVRKDRSCWEG